MYDLLLYFSHKQLDDSYFVDETCSCHL